jgi:hypothetical protein
MILLSGGLIWGCGYQLAAGGKPMGIQMDSIAIPLITSTSSQEEFEAIFTKAIREEFISHAHVPLVPQDRAQGVLTGSISNITTDPLAYDTQESNAGGIPSVYRQTNRRRLRLTLSIKLTDRQSGKVIWNEPVMWEQAYFEVTTDPLQNQYNQDQAIREIARKLAFRIYLKTVERF